MDKMRFETRGIGLGDERLTTGRQHRRNSLTGNLAYTVAVDQLLKTFEGHCQSSKRQRRKRLRQEGTNMVRVKGLGGKGHQIGAAGSASYHDLAGRVCL